jgi:hypothetical protein
MAVSGSLAIPQSRGVDERARLPATNATPVGLHFQFAEPTVNYSHRMGFAGVQLSRSQAPQFDTSGRYMRQRDAMVRSEPSIASAGIAETH